MADWWHSKQWRLIQTNLREIDMLDIRAERIVADLQAFRANVLMINAAGIIASYPTRLPFHFQSPYLKGDSLKDILAACHAAGIRVIARTDFSKVRRPIYETHPDWAYISPTGRIVDYNGDVHACINGPYQQEYALRIIEELLGTHDFDGIFFNMGGYQTHDYSGNYHGPCQCRHCQGAFGAMFGQPLPDREDPEDPLYRQYAAFKRASVRALQEKIYRFISERWPELCIANHLDFRRGFIRQESNTALDRPLPHWQYNASDNTRWAVGSYPEMVSSNSTVDFIDFPSRHVAVSPHEQAQRLAQNLANNGALDYYLIGRLDNHEDRSGFAAIQSIFHYHAANEEAYTGLRSSAGIALLKPSGDAAPVGEYRGWFRTLVENHYLFDVLAVDAAADLPWDRYTAIVVPGVEPMSDELAARLDRFVAAGGALIATGQAGFRDEWGEMRAEPALRCLGIDKVLTVRKDMRASYFKYADKRGFTRFDATDLVYVDGAYVYGQYAPESQPHMSLIPPHKFGPPERCYYEQITQHPAYVVHPFGQGRAIFVPWAPGALFYRQGHPNTADFCADLLEGAAGLKPVYGNLPPMVEVTLFEKIDGSSRLLHLVNGSGHFGNSYYAPLALADLEVVIPCAASPHSVYGLRAGRVYEHDWSGGQLAIRLPRLELFEAIRIA